MAHRTRLFPYFNLVLCVELNPPSISLERLFRRDVADRSSQEDQRIRALEFPIMLAWRSSQCSINDRGNAASSDVPPIPVGTGSGSEDRVSTPTARPGRGPSRQKFEASSGGRIYGQRETAETERNETIWSISNMRLNFCGSIELFRSTALSSPCFLLMILRTTR